MWRCSFSGTEPSVPPVLRASFPAASVQAVQTRGCDNIGRAANAAKERRPKGHQNLGGGRRCELSYAFTPEAAEGVYGDGGNEAEEAWSRVQ